MFKPGGRLDLVGLVSLGIKADLQEKSSQAAASAIASV